MTGYKLVRARNSKSFLPATSLALQRVVYRAGQTTTRPADAGPLAVFESEEAARRFARRRSDTLHLFLCEYTPSTETALWKKLPPTFCKSNYKGGGYYAQSAGETTLDLDECPAGTILAEAVTLLEQIEIV